MASSSITASAVSRRHSWLPRWLTAESALPWLTPVIALLLAFGVYPLLYAVWLSLQERSRVTRQFEFVGLKQWGIALTDPRTWDSF